MATVQQIYIAIFGRPADPVGLAYWNEQTNNGADLSAMIAAFTAAPEYEARFEGQSNAEIISSIYQSLFGREPDDEGLEFYAEALANGELPIETIAVRILDGAQNEDQTSIENKTEAADKFTASIDTPEEIEAYQGTQAATEAQEFLETVNDDPESVPSDEEVDQAVKEVNEGDYNPPEEEPEVPGGPGEPEPQTVLTSAKNENLVGTSADEVFYGTLGTDGTFNTGDSIDGRGGYDALVLQILSAGAHLPGEFTVENVEIVGFVSGDIVVGGAEVTAFAPDLPTLAEPLDASLFADVPHLAQIAASVDVIKLGADQEAIFVDHNVQATVSAAGNAAQVGLDLWESGSTLTFAGENLTTVSVSSFDDPTTGPDEGDDGDTDLRETNLFLETSSDVNEVQIDLDTSQTINLGSGFADALEIFDASNSSGNIFVQFYSFGLNGGSPAAAGAIKTINTGTGDDVVVTANAHPDDIEINSGTGADVVYVTGRVPGVTIDIGDDGAKDIVQVYAGLNNLGDVSSSEMIEDDMTSVTNFDANDILAFVTSEGDAAPLEGDTTIDGERRDFSSLDEDADDLLGALQHITDSATLEYVEAGNWATFQFDGNTYVYQNDDMAGVSVGDGLIELVGFTGGFTTGDDGNLVINGIA